MRSYGKLWEQFIQEKNIIIAIKNSSKGKRSRKDVRKIYKRPGEQTGWVSLYALNFANANHKPIEIYDGISRKKRQIIVPKYREQIIHHMLANVLIPIFMKSMYAHTYGSIPGRGAHNAKKTIRKWIKHDKKNVKYCLKMDIKKFFNSIPHDILKDKLRKIIRDKKFLKVLFEVIDVQPKGLPLGFYTSQWLANWYLTGLDHYIKEELRAKHYVRYMDDMVVFGSKKRDLHRIRKGISEYLEDELGLRLKENWQVFRFDYKKNGDRRGRALDFMGFKFYRDKTTLRKSIMYKLTRKARKIGKKERATLYDCRQMLSYLGWIDSTDSYNMYKKWVKPYVKFGQLKKHISKVDHLLKINQEVDDYESEFWQIPVYADALAA